jgi:hypothetical protein
MSSVLRWRRARKEENPPDGSATLSKIHDVKRALKEVKGGLLLPRYSAIEYI